MDADGGRDVRVGDAAGGSRCERDSASDAAAGGAVHSGAVFLFSESAAEYDAAGICGSGREADREGRGGDGRAAGGGDEDEEAEAAEGGWHGKGGADLE